MNKLVKKVLGIALLGSVVLNLTACGDDKKAEAQATAREIPHSIKMGVVPGPYRDILDKYLKPIVEKNGHELVFVEFTDWVQPDSALDAGDIDANLFQHQVYLEAIVENQGLHLKSVTNFPTLGISVFSDKYKTYEEIPEGSQIGIPNDAVNLARALRVARDLGFITLKSEKNEQKASVADIDKNEKNLVFVPMEAAQLPRSLDSVAAAFVPGNYAYAAKLDFNSALGAEDVKEPIKNVIAVRDGDVDTLGKFFYDAVRDPEFKKGVDSDPVFKNFAKPAWWDDIK